MSTTNRLLKAHQFVTNAAHRRTIKFTLIMCIAVLALLALVSPAMARLTTSSQAALPATATALPPTWFQLAPNAGPPTSRSASGGVLAYDQANNIMMTFGGLTTSNVLLNDYWILVNADGATAGPKWVSLATTNTPAARYSAAGAYDATNNILILYGGCTAFCTPIDNNVYVLSNANGSGGTPTWTQLSTAGGPPAARDGASAVYDPTSNELIVFGGDNGSGGRFNDTWVLSNANGLGGGTPTWTQLSTTGGPPSARVAHSAVYDVTNNRMIVFGGVDCCNNSLNDTWVITDANGVGTGTPTWTHLSPTGTLPPAREDHGAVYDATANTMIIYGGSDTSSNIYGDVWTLSKANGVKGTPAWKQAIPVSTSPAARTEAIVLYRSSTHRLVVFGGGDASQDFNDVWVLLNVR